MIDAFGMLKIGDFGLASLKKIAEKDLDNLDENIIKKYRTLLNVLNN
jgi:hypothetical protein